MNNAQYKRKYTNETLIKNIYLHFTLICQVLPQPSYFSTQQYKQYKISFTPLSIINLTYILQMGSSNEPQRTNSFPHGDQRIGHPSICPKCGIQFPPSITYNILQLHMEICLANNQPVMHPPIQQAMQTQTITQQPKFIYQKLPLNKEKTEFGWQRVQSKAINIQRLRTLSIQQLRHTDFQSKHALFRTQLQKYRIPWESGADTLNVEKENILMTSLQSVYKVNMYKQIKIHFAGDKVNDAGGLLRQWIHIAVKELFNPEMGIFSPTNTDEAAFKIKWDKELDLQFTCSLLELFGVIIGKAIFERIPLNCYLDRTLMRHIIGQQVTLEDISGYDKDLYKSWKYLMSNTIQPFGQYFSVIKQKQDKTVETIELIPNGNNIEVVENNKVFFVKRIINYMCTQSIQKYIDALKKGIHRIIPEKLLIIFEPYELDMLMYGMPFIDLNDWRNNTQYRGAFYNNHQVIQWFWNYMDNLDQAQLARFLQFCTGSSRVPINGFEKLETNRGNCSRFMIQSVVFNSKNPYPKAHTCFNRLELPVYPNEESLKKHMDPLVNNDLEGVYGLD